MSGAQDRRRRIVVATLILFAAGSLGWNPVERRDGPPLRWDVSAPVVWNPDSGPLGLLDNVDAVAMVRDGFAVWGSVPTAAIGFTQGPPIVDGGGNPIDVDADNFLEIVNLDNDQSPVIFDNEQEIWAALGVSTSVIGFAGDLRVEGSTITKGFVMLQGDWLDGVEVRPPNCGGQRCDPELAESGQFLNIVVHEIGHFVGLGHSSVNHEASAVEGCPAPTFDQWETMSPFAHFAMADLHHDDIAGLSSLYPTPEFLTTTSSLSGRVIDRDGTKPFDGANVVLRPVTVDCDRLYRLAQATQSGVNPFENGGAGSYTFSGLDPGADYTVFVTEIGDGGGYPIAPPPLGAPSEFYNGSDEDHFDPPDPPGERVSLTTEAGGTRVSGIDVRLNNAGGPGTVESDGPGALTVDRTETGSLLLSWGVSCNATEVPGQDYAVYAGSLDTVAGIQDHAPIACGTGGLTSIVVDSEESDRYFLVTPLLAGREGDPGAGTGGRLRVPLFTCAETWPGACP